MSGTIDDNSLLIPQQLDAVQADIQNNVDQDKKNEELLASVVATPAWEEVRKLLEAKSSDTWITGRLRPLTTDPKVTDAELGSLCRSTFMAAKDVSETLEHVLATVKAHEK